MPTCYVQGMVGDWADEQENSFMLFDTLEAGA